MRKEDRHKAIIKEINLHNKVLCIDLAAMLKVSDDTIRRDIQELADAGKVLKVHGGAVGLSFVAPFNLDYEVYAQQAKQQIAEKAIRLLKNDSVILTEGGTTILELAKMMPQHLKATVFTVSPQVAITLSSYSNLDVFTIGGRLQKNANLHVGSFTINQLADIKADICLLGANAFSLEEGLTDLDWEVVQVNKALIRASRKVAVLAISEKLNTIQAIRICPVDTIDYLITELDENHDLLADYRSSHLKLL
ncbi:MAG: DeoR/GlpR family DNA-binding transcription regulator [Bacteroidetes bacterium]|nr:DeoR/GlpR family DNA-binding transcription regulator [Bacteroidota bacterium]